MASSMSRGPFDRATRSMLRASEGASSTAASRIRSSSSTRLEASSASRRCPVRPWFRAPALRPARSGSQGLLDARADPRPARRAWSRVRAIWSASSFAFKAPTWRARRARCSAASPAGSGPSAVCPSRSLSADLRTVSVATPRPRRVWSVRLGSCSCQVAEPLRLLDRLLLLCHGLGAAGRAPAGVENLVARLAALRSCRVCRFARPATRFPRRMLAPSPPSALQVLFEAGQLLRLRVLGRFAKCLLLLPVEGTAGAGLLRVALAEHLAEVLPRADQPRESRLLVAAGLAKLRGHPGPFWPCPWKRRPHPAPRQVVHGWRAPERIARWHQRSLPETS